MGNWMTQSISNGITETFTSRSLGQIWPKSVVLSSLSCLVFVKRFVDLSLDLSRQRSVGQTEPWCKQFQPHTNKGSCPDLPQGLNLDGYHKAVITNATSQYPC